jgi:hypothetical protein
VSKLRAVKHRAVFGEDLLGGDPGAKGLELASDVVLGERLGLRQRLGLVEESAHVVGECVSWLVGDDHDFDALAGAEGESLENEPLGVGSSCARR